MVSKSFWFLLASLCVISAAGESVVEIFDSAADKLRAKLSEIGQQILEMQGDGSTGFLDTIKSRGKSFTDQADQVLQQIEEKLKDVSDAGLVRAFILFSRRVSRGVRKFRYLLDRPTKVSNVIDLKEAIADEIEQLIKEGRNLAEKIDERVNTSEANTLENLAEKIFEQALDMLQDIQDRLNEEIGSADTGNPQQQ